MTQPGGPTPVQEVVEAEGHLIDSHVMEQIFDTVVEYHGRFEVEQFRIGRTNSEPSYLRLKVDTADRRSMQQILSQLLGLGCSLVDSGDAELARRGARPLRARRISIPPPTIAPTCAKAASGWKWRISAWTR